MRRYEIAVEGAAPFVFDGERLSSVCGWQGPPELPAAESYVVAHMFRTALGRYVVTREWAIESVSSSSRRLVVSETVAGLVFRMMDENGELFETAPFLGSVDGDLLRLAGYGPPPGDLHALWTERVAARERLGEIVLELSAACRRPDAPAVARLGTERAALVERLRIVERDLEELAVRWLESTYVGVAV